MSARTKAFLALASLALFGMIVSSPAYAGAVRPGFNSSVLPANDDLSTDSAVPVGFTGNFFGLTFSDVFVNNNGNVTIGAPLGEFTPFGLTTNTAIPIIASFFADVDTRVGNVVTYGTGTVDGHPAFGVNYPLVGYFSGNTDKLNDFQELLIDRSDTGAGNFDIEFNYNQIQWETGDASNGTGGLGGDSARVGYSNGTGNPGSFFELPGSGVNGAFLDNNPMFGLIHHSLNSDVLGRYDFFARGGTVINPTGVPEIDPSSMASAFTLLVGGMALLRGRVRRRK